MERGEHPDVESMRRVYAAGGLDEDAMAAEPIDQFTRWFGEAMAAGLPEPNAMVVATASAAGVPSARTVLLKGFSDRGFVFYTNLRSAKGRDLAENPQVALLFPWHALERQVRVTGVAQRLDQSEVERYFASRPRGSQLGAWASEQSAVIDRREVLAEAFEAAGRRWPDGTPVPVPDFWGGFVVVPAGVEFWQGRESRLHDRLRYARDGDGWRLERLAP